MNMHYVIESKVNSATDESLTITFLTNPPQQFRVPSHVLHEALTRHLQAIEQVKKMSEMISFEIPGAGDDYPIEKQ